MKYFYIANTGTFRILGTNLVDTQGTLARVIINTPLANGVVEIYDNNSGDATGQRIARIALPGSLLNNGPIIAEYNCEITKGLTVKVSGANVDLTVIYS